jgi:hypothetical protein
MNRQAFDSSKYLKLQSEKILERIGIFESARESPKDASNTRVAARIFIGIFLIHSSFISHGNKRETAMGWIKYIPRVFFDTAVTKRLSLLTESDSI